VERIPQTVKCSDCGYLLYEGDILKSPQDIMKKYGGRCPHCNKRLTFSSQNVAVTPCE
jgi:DNA-directed RNA polymerase subunit RPC12/RpoP